MTIDLLSDGWKELEGCGCTKFELANIKCMLEGMNFIDIIYIII
jgi:hypothetical protein